MAGVDLNGDGVVNALDVSILMSQFGQSAETADTAPALEPTLELTPTPLSSLTPTPTVSKSLIQTLIDFVLNLFGR